MKDPDKESTFFLIKDSLIGGLGGALATVITVTLLCLPYFAAFAIVFWVFMQF